MSVVIDGTLGVTTPAETVSGTGVWSVGGTQIYKDASGNVGIGTATPSGPLQVSRASGVPWIDVTGGSYTTRLFTNSASTGLSGIFAVTNNPLSFGVNNTEAARIDSSGNLLVGTAALASSTTGFVTNAINTGYGSIGVCHSTAATSGTAFQNFYYNASLIGSITQNGTTGVLYNLTSDYRLKNDQQPLTGAKEFVMALQPKKWQWWDGSGEGVGFIAHEFMEVAKYSGHGEKDAVDEEGKIIAQSIQPSSSEVMANLVSLLQEQQAIIEALRADVAELKAKIG